MITPEFDIKRAIIEEEPFTPPLSNPQIIPLADAQQTYKLAASLPILVTEIGEQKLVFNTAHLVYYHVSQGKLNDEPWMVSFCMICNAGFCFSPVVDGQVYEFFEFGIYNAMTILGDTATHSVWHHITGKCMHGELAGKALTRRNVLQHATLGQILASDPQALYVVSQLDEETAEMIQSWEAYRRQAESKLPADWIATLPDQQQQRLPHMEAGLGVWDGKQARFYPYRALHANNNLILDRFGDDQIIIFEDAETDFPAALYIEATSAEMRGNSIRLANGDTIRNGLLYRADGQLQTNKRPLQLFQRYFSFAVLFPEGDIFGL